MSDTPNAGIQVQSVPREWLMKARSITLNKQARVLSGELEAVGTPVKRVIIDPRGRACTDGETVWIPMMIHEDERINRIAQEAILAHEAAGHLRYTDFGAWKNICDNIKRGKEDRLLHDFTNILEDARVNHLLSQDFAGSGKALDATQAIFMERHRESWAAKSVDEIIPRQAAVIALMTEAIVHEPHFFPHIPEVVDFMDEARTICTTAISQPNTKSVIKQAKRLITIYRSRWPETADETDEFGMPSGKEGDGVMLDDMSPEEIEKMAKAQHEKKATPEEVNRRRFSDLKERMDKVNEQARRQAQKAKEQKDAQDAADADSDSEGGDTPSESDDEADDASDGSDSAFDVDDDEDECDGEGDGSGGDGDEGDEGEGSGGSGDAEDGEDGSGDSGEGDDGEGGEGDSGDGGSEGDSDSDGGDSDSDSGDSGDGDGDGDSSGESNWNVNDGDGIDEPCNDGESDSMGAGGDRGWAMGELDLEQLFAEVQGLVDEEIQQARDLQHGFNSEVDASVDPRDVIPEVFGTDDGGGHKCIITHTTESFVERGLIEVEQYAEGYTAVVRENQTAITTMVNELKRTLKGDNSKHERGLKRGLLDSRKLAYHRTDNRLFQKKTEPKKAEANVVILIDSSGSMGGTRAEKAAQTACVFAEVFDNLGFGCEIVDFASHGHTTGIRIRKQMNAPLNQITKAAIRAPTAGGSNADGYAVEWCLDRLKKFNGHRMLFVISDGQPAGPCPPTMNCDEHLIWVVQNAPKDIGLFSVGIDGMDTSTFYPNAVSVANSNDLIREAMPVIRKMVRTVKSKKV